MLSGVLGPEHDKARPRRSDDDETIVLDSASDHLAIVAALQRVDVEARQ